MKQNIFNYNLIIRKHNAMSSHRNIHNNYILINSLLLFFPPRLHTPKEPFFAACNIKAGVSMPSQNSCPSVHTAALSSSRNKKFPVENNEINQLGLNFNRNVSAAYFFFTEISSLSSLLSFKASLIFPITKSLFRCLLTRN